MALWAVKLSAFDIQYCLRTTIKGQAIADFIAKFTNMVGQGQKSVQGGVSAQTDRPTNSQAEQVWYSIV